MSDLDRTSDRDTVAGRRPRRMRRQRSLRRMLATVLVGAALASLLLSGAYNYALARGLLTAVTKSQLAGQQAAAVRGLRDGLQRIEDQTAIIARDPATADALERFSAVSAALEALPPDRRAGLVTPPNDDTPYARAHAELHPQLAEVASAAGYDDVLLIDPNGTVVYSVAKRPDFGTNLVTGPYRDTALGTAVSTRVTQAGVDRPVLVDPQPYPPADDRPVMFAAAVVADGANVVGAVAVEIPAAAINALTTNEQRWRQGGFGDSGEVYVVGTDRRMRSDARGWLTDPDGYLAALDDAGYPSQLGAAIGETGSTIGLQPVETAAVDAALDGAAISERGVNYLGEPTLAIAGPLPTSAVDWVVVAEVAIAEGAAPLAALELRLLLAALIVVPVVAAVGLVLADRISRPLVPVVAAAAAVARGELDTPIADHGATEVGDVGRRLDRLAADLRSQRIEQARQKRAVSELLGSVLPPRLVERLDADDTLVEDLTDTATVIAVTVDGAVADTGRTEDEAADLTARLSRELEAAAEELGIERIRSASYHHLFAAGLESPGVEADTAARFASAVGDVIARIEADANVDLRHRLGMSAGTIVAGLLHPDTLTYRVLGEPVRRALTLAAVAADGQALVDASVVERLGDEWDVRTMPDLTDLRGEPVQASALVGRTQSE